GLASFRCTPSTAGATTIVPPRSRMLTRVPGAQPSARTALRSATRPLLSTGLTTYTVPTARAEPGFNPGTGSGPRRRPGGPAPARTDAYCTPPPLITYGRRAGAGRSTGPGRSRPRPSPPPRAERRGPLMHVEDADPARSDEQPDDDQHDAPQDLRAEQRHD